MKIKLRGIFFAFLLIWGLIVTDCFAQELQPSQLYAKSAVLLDAESGRVLYGKDESVVMPMASTTKIMTCILALEYLADEDIVEVSDYAAGMPKVKLYMRAGEKYRVKDLLYSLMLESHNDTAVALAEAIGRKSLGAEGSEQIEKETDCVETKTERSKAFVAAFVKLMNEKAASIGCIDTWFITPNGLDATQEFWLQGNRKITKMHSTTARELAMIMAYCITKSDKKDAFLSITQTRNYSFCANNRSFSLVNHNALLDRMEGLMSGKTGFTNRAGYCYVGALERDGDIYVIALLACGWPNNRSYKWKDARKLFDYGTKHYRYKAFERPENCLRDFLNPLLINNAQTEGIDDDAYVEIKVESAEEVPLNGLLMREEEEVQYVVEMNPKSHAPVTRGSEMGRVYYMVDKEVYREDKLVYGESVKARDFWWCVDKVTELFMMKK